MLHAHIFQSNQRQKSVFSPQNSNWSVLAVNKAESKRAVDYLSRKISLDMDAFRNW
jgi:hypothetical protein